MPLRKLWNAFRGQSAVPTAADPTVAEIVESKSDLAASSADSRPVSTRQSPTRVVSAAAPGETAGLPNQAAGTRVSLTGPVQPVEGVKPVKAAKPDRRYAKLVQTIANESKRFADPVRSVLEIGVEDGSRAIAVMTSLRSEDQVSGDLQYVAIDQFEMAGGKTTLMEFHRTLRSGSLRPQVFPEPVQSGLTRVARTVGAVDLILISEPIAEGLGAIESQLARVAHPETIVLVQSGDRWSKTDLAKTEMTRRATPPTVRQAA